MPIMGKITGYMLSEDETLKHLRKKQHYNLIMSLLKIIFSIGFMFLIIYGFVVRPYQQIDKSMEPTIKDGSYSLELLLPLRFSSPNRQDIIVYNEIGTVSTGIARIIGIPGDRIILKNGYIYLNGKFLEEPYTLKPRTTWVNYYTNMKPVLGVDCKEIIVPKDNYFVLGDNREQSGGSIYGNFTPKNSIIGFIPGSLIRFLNYNPIDLTSHLRDTSHDKDLQNKSLLDINSYIGLINKKRAENSLPALTYDKRLEKSTYLRLQNMLKYNDFNYTASKSGYVMWNALNDVGITDGLAAERIIFGFFNSNDLFNLYWQTDDKKNLLLNKSPQLIGITTKIINVDGCPRQITVQYFWGE